MTKDTGSLDHLVDVVVPEAVSWWPPAPGWWVLLGLLVAGGAVAAVRAVLRWRRDAYRRAACAELDRIADRVSVDRVNGILKRTALCAWPREEVAPLAGEAWIEFLRRNGPVPTGSGRMMDLAYTSTVFGGRDGAVLKESARKWIEGHKTGESHQPGEEG